MAELWASTGAIWRDMLLAEALVCFLHVGLYICRSAQTENEFHAPRQTSPFQ